MRPFIQIGLVALCTSATVGLSAYRTYGSDFGLGLDLATFTSAQESGSNWVLVSSSEADAKPAPSITPEWIRNERAPTSLKFVDMVLSKRLHPHSPETVGEQLDENFSNHRWVEERSKSGARVAGFRGGLNPDAAWEVRTALSNYLEKRPQTKSWLEVEEDLSTIKEGTELEIDLVLSADSERVHVARLGTGDKVLRQYGIPASVWAERLLR